MEHSYISITTEIFSLIICAILFLYQLVGSMAKDKEYKYFTGIIIFNSFMLIGDICSWMFDGIQGKFYYLIQLLIGVVIYYLATGAIIYCMFRWVISCVERVKKVPVIWNSVAMILCGFQILIAFTLPITKINYIDEFNRYNRGKYFYLSVFFPILLYLSTIIIFLCYCRYLQRKEAIYLGFFISVPCIAGALQIVSSKLNLYNAVISLGLIVNLMFIQYQKEMRHEEELTNFIVKENKKLAEMRSFQENLSEQLIEALCGAVEAKDIYTRGHSLRVAEYAREIMYRLGGDEAAQQEIYYIGILHDVGKISVKDEIINKKGRLTDKEYEQIKLHTVAGYQILRGIDVIPNIAIGARWHHERFDGKGYPNGLAGENIPLIARIISVADAYDAMTSNRSYHKTMPQSVVKEEIIKGMGTQFDPKIAQIMLDMINEDLQYEMKQVNTNDITNILMIDDDSIMHKVMKKVLVDEYNMVTSAYSGKEGIELLKENKYDLCLLDMEMPEMNGFEVLEWIHNNIRGMKVIFVTGDKDVSVIRKSKELGANDYITKPVNPTILKESVNAVLRH